MDTQKLVAAIEAEIKEDDRWPEEKIFLKLLKEVWQIDWTVPPYTVWSHMMEYNIPFFLRFMGVDQGDEEAEKQLIQEWAASMIQLQSRTPELQQRIKIMINEVNNLRAAISQDV